MSKLRQYHPSLRVFQSGSLQKVGFLIGDIPKVFVRRDTEEGNKEADKLANSALDSKINADNDEHKIKVQLHPKITAPNANMK